MKKTLVVPSCRAGSLTSFRVAWDGIGDWDELIVVEDGPARTFDLPDVPGIRHLAWPQIDDELGEDAWIISRQDSAIRCFGLYMAWKGGADLVVTLDDDCYPREARPICGGHVLAMASHARWVESVPGMRTRGLPYGRLGTLDVAANMGLWSHVPDLDAVQALSGHPHARGGFEPPAGSRVIPAGQYFPMCGMNLAIRRAAIPLFYFPLMGHGSPYRRFDDIWAGVIAKKCLDHLGWPITVGEPAVRHARASDPLVNLVKEAPGVAANETFWRAVDECELTASDPAGCMDELGGQLGQPRGDLDDPYLRRLGRALRVWAGLFTRPGA